MPPRSWHCVTIVRDLSTFVPRRPTFDASPVLGEHLDLRPQDIFWTPASCIKGPTKFQTPLSNCKVRFSTIQTPSNTHLDTMLLLQFFVTLCPFLIVQTIASPVAVQATSDLGQHAEPVFAGVTEMPDDLGVALDDLKSPITSLILDASEPNALSNIYPGMPGGAKTRRFLGSLNGDVGVGSFEPLGPLQGITSGISGASSLDVLKNLTSLLLSNDPLNLTSSFLEELGLSSNSSLFPLFAVGSDTSVLVSRVLTYAFFTAHATILHTV